MRLRSIIIVLILFVVTGCFLGIVEASENTNTEKVLSLQDCISIALKSHPDLKSAYALINSARARVGQSVAAYYPKVDFMSYYRGSGGPGNVPTVNGGFLDTQTEDRTYFDSLALKQYIYDFGKTAKNVTFAQENLNAAICDMLTTQNDIIFNVKKSYFSYVASEELLKVKKETVASQENHLKQSEAFYSVGRRSKIEVTKSEVDLAQAKLDLIKTENLSNIAKLALVNSMGLTGNFSNTLKKDLPDFEFKLSIEQVLEKTEKNRPELLKAEAQIRAGKAKIAAIIAELYPNISGNASYEWMNDLYPLDRYWKVGVTLTMPITDGNFIVNKVKEAKFDFDSLMAKKDRLWQNIYLEVNKAYSSLKEAQERIVVSRKALLQSEENFRLAEGRYNVGVGSNLEYNDAQLALLSAKTNLISAIVDYLIADADLAKSMGMEIEKEKEWERIRKK